MSQFQKVDALKQAFFETIGDLTGQDPKILEKQQKYYDLIKEAASQLKSCKKPVEKVKDPEFKKTDKKAKEDCNEGVNEIKINPSKSWKELTTCKGDDHKGWFYLGKCPNEKCVVTFCMNCVHNRTYEGSCACGSENVFEKIRENAKMRVPSYE